MLVFCLSLPFSLALFTPPPFSYLHFFFILLRISIVQPVFIHPNGTKWRIETIEWKLHTATFNFYQFVGISCEYFSLLLLCSFYIFDSRCLVQFSLIFFYRWTVFFSLLFFVWFGRNSTQPKTRHFFLIVVVVRSKALLRTAVIETTVVNRSWEAFFDICVAQMDWNY